MCFQGEIAQSFPSSADLSCSIAHVNDPLKTFRETLIPEDALDKPLSPFAFLISYIEENPVQDIKVAQSLSDALKIFLFNQTPKVICSFLNSKISGDFVLDFFSKETICRNPQGLFFEQGLSIPIFYGVEDNWIDALLQASEIIPEILFLLLHHLHAIKVEFSKTRLLKEREYDGLEKFILHHAEKLKISGKISFHEFEHHLHVERLQEQESNWFLMQAIHENLVGAIYSSNYPCFHFPEEQVKSFFKKMVLERSYDYDSLLAFIKNYVLRPVQCEYILEGLIESLNEDELINLFETYRLLPNSKISHGTYIEKWIFENNWGSTLIFFQQMLHLCSRLDKFKLLKLFLEILYESISYDFSKQRVLPVEKSQSNITVLQWLLITSQEQFFKIFERFDFGKVPQIEDETTRFVLRASQELFNENTCEHLQFFDPVFLSKLKKKSHKERVFLPALFLIGLSHVPDYSIEILAGYFFDPSKKRTYLKTLFDHYDDTLIPKMLDYLTEDLQLRDVKCFTRLDDFRFRLGTKVIEKSPDEFLKQVTELIQEELSHSEEQPSLILKNILFFLESVENEALKAQIHQEIIKATALANRDFLPHLLGNAFYFVMKNEITLTSQLEALAVCGGHYMESLRSLNLSSFDLLFLRYFLSELEKKISLKVSFSELGRFTDRTESIVCRYINLSTKKWLGTIHQLLSFFNEKMKAQALEVVHKAINSDNFNSLEICELREYFPDLFDQTFDLVYLSTLEEQKVILTPKAFEIRETSFSTYSTEADKSLRIKSQFLAVAKDFLDTLKASDIDDANLAYITDRISQLPESELFSSSKARLVASLNTKKPADFHQKLLEWSYSIDPYNLMEVLTLFESIEFSSSDQKKMNCSITIHFSSDSEMELENFKQRNLKSLKENIQEILAQSFNQFPFLKLLGSSDYYIQLEKALRTLIDIWKDRLAANQHPEQVGWDLLTLAQINLKETSHFLAFVEASIEMRKAPLKSFKKEFLPRALTSERIIIISELCQKIAKKDCDVAKTLYGGIHAFYGKKFGLKTIDNPSLNREKFQKIFDAATQKSFFKEFYALYSAKVIHLTTQPIYPNGAHIYDWNGEFFLRYFEKKSELPLLNKSFSTTETHQQSIIGNIIHLNKTAKGKIHERSKIGFDLLVRSVELYYQSEKGQLDSQVYLFSHILEGIFLSLEKELLGNSISKDQAKAITNTEESFYRFLISSNVDSRFANSLAKIISHSSDFSSMVEDMLVNFDINTKNKFIYLVHIIELEKCILYHAGPLIDSESLLDEFHEYLRVILSSDSFCQLLAFSMLNPTLLPKYEIQIVSRLNDYFFLSIVKNLFSEQLIRVTNEDLDEILQILSNHEFPVKPLEDKLKKIIHECNLGRLKHLQGNYLSRKRPIIEKIYQLMAAGNSEYSMRENNPKLEKIDAIYRRFL